MASGANAAPGDYDTTFGPFGAVQYHVSYGLYVSSPGYSQIEQQPDGKLLFLSATNTASARLILRRHHSNGMLDTSFGLAGEAVARRNTHLFSFTARPLILKFNLMAEQSSLAMLDILIPIHDWQFGASCPTGTLDTTFGNEGVLMRPIPSLARSVDIYDGNIYIVGWFPGDGILCITGSGSPCSSVNGFGPSVAILDGVSRIFVQPGVGIVAAGGTHLRRFTFIGELDTSFGVRGVATASCNSAIGDVAAQSGNRLVVSSPGGPGSTSYLMSRLDVNGDPDTSFGVDGCVNRRGKRFPTPELHSDDRIVVLEGENLSGDAISWKVRDSSPGGCARSLIRPSG